MERRTFLRHLTHSVAVPGFLSAVGLNSQAKAQISNLLHAANESGKVLVIIYLQGGNDGLNTVIPLDQFSALNQLRPHVILPENTLLQLNNFEVALHPSLPNFRSLFEEGRMRIVQNVAYPEQNFSHFRSTDIWMSGSNSHEIVNSGWTGRYLNSEFPEYPIGFPNETAPHPLAVELGNGGSLMFQGPAANMSMVINNPDDFYRLVENEQAPVPDTLAGERLKFVRLISEQSQQYGEVVTEVAKKVKNQAEYPQTRLAQQLKIVSRLIAGGLQTPLYMVSLGGFDTHDAQVVGSNHTRGEHADLLKTLDDAVMAFMQDLEVQQTDDKVVGMTFSEFGRRIVSNASLGTDHGAAAPMFFFGNNVIGGIEGKNPEIDRSMTYQDNLAMQYDFRQVYGSILSQWLGKEGNELNEIMLGDFESIPIIKNNSVTSIGDTINAESNILEVYPNPIQSNSKIRYISDGDVVNITLVDIQGRVVRKIFQGKRPKGAQEFVWDARQIPKGHYFIRVQNENFRYAKAVLKN